MEPQNNPNKKLGVSIAVIAIVALIFISVVAGKKTTPTDQTAATTVDQPVAVTPTKTTTGSATYKDGTYTATGSYMSPGGQDQLGVTLTLKGDIVTDATVTPAAGDNTSARYQSVFIAGYKQYVIGKDISTLKLTKVSGSSLTGAGFNDAVAKIEAQAKA